MMRNNGLNVLVLTKRQYTNKDLIDDRFGRIWELPAGLAAKGHRITGLCLSYKKRSEGVFHADGMIWESINAGPLKIAGLRRFCRRARQLAQDADVIWASSDSIYGIIGYYLACCLRIPFVFDLLDNYEYFLLARLPLLKQMYRYVVCKCEAVTCVSMPLQNLVVSYGRLSDTYVVENATAPDVFKPLDQAVCRKELALPSEACLIGTAGHLAKNRGIKYLFHAFEILKQRHSDIYLVLAGPCAVTIPDDPRIHYLGFLPLEKAAVVMNALDVAVVCNQDNAFGRYCFPQKVREIMACDVPLVAAGVGSMQEVLRETPEWLYRMDSAASLAAAVENRLQDRRTGYGKVPVWTDHAGALEKILINVIHK